MKTIYHIILFTLFSIQIFAQSNFVYKNFTNNDGLPSNETYQLRTDTKGYLWIATDRGVSRFDGRVFTNYGVKDGLTDLFVNKIFISPRGTIWVVGLNRHLFYFKDEKFIAFQLNDQLSTILNQSIDGILDITFKNEQPYLIATFLSGFLNVDAKTNKIKTDFNDKNLLYKTFKYASEDNFYYINFNEASTNKSRVSLFDTTINFIGIEPRMYRNDSIAFVAFSNYLYKIKGDKVLQKCTIEQIALHVTLDKQNNLWLANGSNGVSYWSKNNLEYQPIKYLNEFRITSTAQDFEGGYWFSTHNNGILYVPFLEVQLLDLSQTDHKLNLKKLYSFEDKLLVGTDNLIAYNLMPTFKTIDFKKFQSTNKLFDSTLKMKCYCNSFCYDSTSNLIGVGFSNRYYLLDKQFKFKNLLAKACSDLSANKTEWHVVSPNGYTIYDKQNQFKKAFPKTFYSVLANDSSAYLGLQDGLYTYKNNSIYKTHPLVTCRVTDIVKFNKRFNLAATLGQGLVLFNDTEYKQISLIPESSNNMVNEITIANNKIWCATELGICIVTIDTSNYNYSLKFLNKYNSYFNNKIESINAFNGCVYALSQNKITEIKSDLFFLNFTKPKIELNYIIVNNKDTFASKALPSLTYKNNDLQFVFNAIAFRSGQFVKYKYRLLGYDSVWHYTTQDMLHYYALENENYTLQIFAVNENGFQSENPINYSFSLSKPFWKKLWFTYLVFCMAFVLMLFYFYYLLKNIRQKNKLRNEFLRFQQQALVAQINPHFIFNTLNNIQSYILTEEKKTALKYLNKFSKLMRLILDNSRKVWVPLSAEKAMLENYLELEALRFKEKFTYIISIDDNIKIDSVIIPTMLIQPFIENAIKHGINNLQNRIGNILILIKFENNNLLCSIEDNGVGRSQAELLKTGYQKEHISAGIDITISRLQMLIKEQNQKYFYEVIDKPNNMGTIIKINLPYILQHD